MRAARTLQGVLVAGAIAALAVTPAFAQDEASAKDDNDVTCSPTNPGPGDETTCTAEGLQPSSVFDWTATFADGTENSGTGSADDEGTGEFTVMAPDSEEANGEYTVTVTGTDDDGSDYEAKHEGEVGGTNLFGPLAQATEPPSDEPSDEPTDEPTEEPSDDPSAPPPGGDSGQVNPAPSGAVATGAGGTATDTGVPVGLFLGVVALAGTGALIARRRTATDA